MNQGIPLHNKKSPCHVLHKTKLIARVCDIVRPDFWDPSADGESKDVS